MSETEKRYSGERRDGFLKIVKNLTDDLNKLKKLSAGKVKQRVVDELQEEVDVFKQMADAEEEFFTGVASRGIRKFLLSDNQFTWKLNPEWKPKGVI